MDAVLVDQVARAVSDCPTACELYLTAFSASLGHYRRASVCTPFPRSLFPCTSELDENDYSGVSRVLESLPYLSKLGSREDLSRRTAPEIALLHWLFHDRLLSRHKRMKEVGLEDLKNSLHKAGGAFSGEASGMLPSTVLELEYGVEVQQSRAWAPNGSLFAFHGTSLENLHSILHNGLLNLSGTALQRTGAAHGNGIYCSTDMQVAFSFCRAGSTGPWGGCRLGKRLRALIVCDVKTEAVPVDTDGLPEKYLVIQAAEMVRLRYILLYVDQTDEGKQAAGGWTARIPDIGTLVVVLYGLVLLCIGLAKNMNLT